MEALGINPVLLIAQIISFTILFVILKKFLYSKIQEALEQRRKAVETTYTGQAEIEKKLENFRAQQEEKQKKANEEMRKQLVEAREAAERLRKEILEKAEAEGGREIQKAEARITKLEEETREKLSVYVKDLSREIVEKIIAGKTGDVDWQKDQIKKSVSQLRSGKVK